MEWMEVIIAILAGLAWGSFVSVCITRWSIRFANNEDQQRILLNPAFSKVLKEHLRRGDLSPFSPCRSFCFACGHQLHWYELIPVLSYFFLAGFCRTCGDSYGTQSLWIELSHGIFFGIAIVFMKLTPETLLLAIDFSFLSLLGYCFAYPRLGSRLIITGMLLMVGNWIVFFKYFCSNL